MNYKEETLSNNLKLLFLEKSDSPLCSLLLFVNFGVRNEKDNTCGLAAFITNLILRGSQKYQNDLALGTVLDNLGGYFNTEVQKEYTTYYIKLMGEKLGEAADFFAELLSNPVFVLAEVDREKKLCRSDIENRKKNPEQVTMDEFLNIAYGGSSLGSSGIANDKFTDSIKRDDLVSYHGQYYCGSNMIAVVVGPKEAYETQIGKIKEGLNKIPAGTRTSFEPFESQSVKPEAKRIEFESGDNVYITFGYPGVARYDEDRRIVDFIETILSRGRANERLLPIYLKRTPAIAIRTTNQVFSDCGEYIVQLLAHRNTVRLAYQQIIEQMEVIKNREIGNEEMKRMKNWYTGSLTIQVADPTEFGFFHALSYIFNDGKIVTYQEAIEKIKSIKTDEVMEVGKKIFDQEKMAVVMVGKNLDQLS